MGRSGLNPTSSLGVEGVEEVKTCRQQTELIRKMRDLWAAVPPNVCSSFTWHRGRVRWEMTAQNLGQHIPETA